MGLIDLTADLTYNSNFETEPIENQQQPVSGEFQTSDLESSPTEEIGSVNFFQNPHGANEDGSGGFSISGFTQFMDYPDTLYPGEGLNNSGIVDHFPNPHNYDGDTGFEIEGFTANMQKYETLYPSKDNLEISGINNGIVDFFPSPHGIGHFGAETQSPHNIEGFVADVQPLSDGFYPNTIELGSVDFFPGGNFSNNFLTSTGFTQNAEPFGGSKIETEFLMVGGETSLNQDFMGNELFQSIKTLGTYKGAVDFISDTDSYATGFTKNMQPIGGDKLDTQYDVSTYYTDKELTFGTSITRGTPNPSVTTYGILTDSIFTTDVADVTTTPEFSVYSLGDFQPGGVAGLGLPGDSPFTLDDLKLDMNSWNVGGFNIDDFTNFGDNATGYTKGTYSLGESQFTFEDGAGNPKLEGVGYSGNFSSLSIGYSSIPSLSIPKPTENAVSGPFSSNSGFEDGDFKLLASDQGFIPRYLQTEGTLKAAEGSIVRDANELNIRSGATTLGKLFNNGKYDEDGGKGTIFRDIKNMGGMAQTVYGTAYGDGINDGWMKGLIDTKVPIGKPFSGNTADFFVRESSGGRFVGRIVKDLLRLTKWQFSSNGLLSLAKNGIMTFFNPSEKSLQLNAIAQFTAAAGNMFGLRPTSAFSSIVDLVTNAVYGKSSDSLLYYESRVNKPHPNIGNVAQSFLNNINPIPTGDLDGGRTLVTRYGAPIHPERGRFGARPKRAHELYARGFKDRTDGEGFNAIDFINIKGYDDSSPDDYGDVKDLIKFYIRDLRNGKIIRLRAFITGLTDAITPQYNPYKFIGRPDEVYTYKGTSRAVSFTLKVAAMSRHEMYPMWEKLNYLVGLTYGSYADTNTDGAYAQVNPGMSAPLTMMTIGDYLVDQPGYIKDLSITVADDYPWDVIIDDEGKNAVGELPQALDINVGYQIIPQQIPDSYGKHFGKVGTQDVRGEDGLPWLPDFYQNDGVSAVERYEGLGSSNPPEPAESTPEQGEPEDTTNTESAPNGESTAQDAATKVDLPAE